MSYRLLLEYVMTIGNITNKANVLITNSAFSQGLTDNENYFKTQGNNMTLSIGIAYVGGGTNDTATKVAVVIIGI